MTYIENNMYLTGGIEVEVHNENRNQLSVDDWQNLLDANGYGWVEAKYDASLTLIANSSCHRFRFIWQAARMTISACCWNSLNATVAVSRNQVAACMFILETARSAINRRAIFDGFKSGKYSARSLLPCRARHGGRHAACLGSRRYPTLCRAPERY